MLKVVGIIGLALAAFVGAVIASAAATGKLNQESLDYLLGRAETVEDLLAQQVFDGLPLVDLGDTEGK